MLRVILATALCCVSSTVAAAQELSFVEAQFDGVAGVEGLLGASRVAVSPSGGFVVVAAAFDNALALFSREPSSGRLTFRQRLHDSQGDGLAGASGLAFSPDGRFLYSAAILEGKIGVFSLDGSRAELAFIQAVEDGVAGVDGLDGVRSVLVSADGRQLYSVAIFDDALAVFDRDPETGELTFSEAHFDNQMGVDGLDFANGLALSPDGSFLYAASAIDSAVAAFVRDGETGRLQFLEAHFDEQGGVEGLDDANDVAVTPDSQRVVVASHPDPAGGDGWLSVFARDPATGRLSFVEDLPNPVPGTAFGCTGGIVDPSVRLALARDGSRIYVTNAAHNAIATLRLDSSGHLELLDMACNGVAGVEGLLGASGVAVSPDGRSVYGTSFVDNALVTLRATNLIFLDGFERGDVTSWSSTFP